jgi:hypothetical protein
MDKDKLKICVDYALEILLPGKDASNARGRIAYCQDDTDLPEDARVCIISSGFFDENYGKSESLPALPLKEIEAVPLLYGQPEIRRQDGRLIVYADIIASAYFMVTPYEEMASRDVRDEHGRFTGKESLPYRAGFINRPIVDQYAELLRKWLREVGVETSESDRRFSVLLTHDIDVLRRFRNILNYIRMPFGILLGRQEAHNFPNAIAVLLGLKNDPMNTFEEMIELEKTFCEEMNPVDAEIVYFFLAGDKTKHDRMYNIRSKPAKEAITAVYESGAKIGLHASYGAGVQPELIAAEKAILEDVCGFEICRNRHHYLTWREIEDGWAMAKAGINWDATLGYADMAGFRLGVCRPIPLFDPIKIKLFGIEEHPLVVMDCTLDRKKYMNLDETQALTYCKELIDQTRKYNGEFVVLWHNTAFVKAWDNYHTQLYPKLLSELTANNEKN